MRRLTKTHVLGFVLGHRSSKRRSSSQNNSNSKRRSSSQNNSDSKRSSSSTGQQRSNSSHCRPSRAHTDDTAASCFTTEGRVCWESGSVKMCRMSAQLLVALTLLLSMLLPMVPTPLLHVQS